MEDIIALESALSETELQIEYLTGSLRRYDSLVGYSTVNLQLREVYRLAQPELRQGYDVVLVARSRSVSGPYTKLTAAFSRACAQVGLTKEVSP